jgi:predicted DNA-binding transcriptional regulator AlpA
MKQNAKQFNAKDQLQNHLPLVPGRLLRISQIIPELLPVSRSHFWSGVKKGIYPKPFKLSPRTTVWRSEDIIALIENGFK